MNICSHAWQFNSVLIVGLVLSFKPAEAARTLRVGGLNCYQVLSQTEGISGARASVADPKVLIPKTDWIMTLMAQAQSKAYSSVFTVGPQIFQVKIGNRWIEKYVEDGSTQNQLIDSVGRLDWRILTNDFPKVNPESVPNQGGPQDSVVVNTHSAGDLKLGLDTSRGLITLGDNNQTLTRALPGSYTLTSNRKIAVAASYNAHTANGSLLSLEVLTFSKEFKMPLASTEHIGLRQIDIAEFVGEAQPKVMMYGDLILLVGSEKLLFVSTDGQYISMQLPYTGPVLGVEITPKGQISIIQREQWGTLVRSQFDPGALFFK